MRVTTVEHTRRWVSATYMKVAELKVEAATALQLKADMLADAAKSYELAAEVGKSSRIEKR